MLKYLGIAIAFIFSIVLFSSCNKDLTPAEQWDADIAIITQHIADNNLDMIRTDSGLHYTITEDSGNSEYATINSTVTVRYKGYYLDGVVFDETAGSDSIEFPLSNLILAWQEAIPLMPNGSKLTLIAPSALCYGTNGAGSIPPNTVLMFDIELVDF